MKHGSVWLLVGVLAAACGGAETRSVSMDGGTGSGAGTDAGDVQPAVITSRLAAIVSAAPRYALAGEDYRYRPNANGKLDGLTIDEGPPGLSARDGLLSWQPSTEHAGTHRVSLRGETGQGPVTQTFALDVATSTPRARGEVTASSGGTVIASSTETLGWRGVGVVIPSRAVLGNTSITVSEVDRAPALPNANGRLRAVRFEPAGTVFETPAQLMLPLPEGMSGSASRLRAYVYDVAGQWVRVPVVAVDLESNLVIARASHFSVYAAMEPSLDLAPVLVSAPPTSVCAGKLMASAPLTGALAAVQLESVNNLSEALRAALPEASATVRDLLSAASFRGSLRQVQVFELREPGSEVVAEEAITVTTLFAPADGSVTITHTDALGNLRAQKRFAQPATAIAEIEEHLQGRATAVGFATAATSGQTLSVRMHLAYAEGDASYEPVDTRDLGLAAVEADPVTSDAAARIDDADCDGLLDGFDPVDDALAPTLDFSPRQVVRAFPDESVTLRARVVGPQVLGGEWRVLDGAGARLESVGDVSDGRAFSASQSGRYLISFRAGSAAATLEHVFAVDVVAPPAVNTPPRCQPAKASDTGRVGDPIDLTAVAVDAETDPRSLRIEWGLYDAATGALTATPQLAATRERARLVPSEAGSWVIGCRAFDGQLQGAVSTLELSVAPVAQNRVPELTVSPREAVITTGQSVVVRAWARDPDGDALTSTWTLDGKVVSAVGTTAEGRLEVRGEAPATQTIEVEVSDGRASARATVLVHVRDPALPTIDADLDGFFAGTTPASDCNDADFQVHPGARERCDKRDDNCDGQIDEGGVCGVIDPCATDNGRCDPLTRCVSVPGGRTCTACPAGYEGTGEGGCKDIDECATIKTACDPRTTCTNAPGGFRCSECPAGFLGSGSAGCVDIDECRTNNGGCDPRTQCVNTIGGFTCGGCPTGYVATAAGGCVDVDECLTNNGGCAEQVKCVNAPGTFSCGDCPAGFTGGGAAGCVDIDECLTNNGGCDRLTKCENTAGNRLCSSCPPGYTGTGDTACVDVNECVASALACSDGRLCTNTPGSFTCGCSSGFTFDGKACVDIDECATAASPCPQGLVCTNGVGSFKCGCEAGSFDENGDGKVCARAASLSAGVASTCAITTSGSLFCWGRMIPKGSPVPTRFDAGADWRVIALWGAHACGIRGIGALACWGENGAGQLGIGSTSAQVEPTAIAAVQDRPGSWTHVAVGDAHTCARLGESLYCWGDNKAGQVGTTLTLGSALEPQHVSLFDDWMSITAGGQGSCAIRSGLASCWGAVGLNTTAANPEPVQISQAEGWSALAVGNGHACGIRSGMLSCWGDNTRGQLGIGSTEPLARITQVGTASTWTRVVAHRETTCGIMAGRLYCWGDLGTLANSNVPVAVGEATDWTDVAVGPGHRCGVRGDGLVYCWGQNGDGQLGTESRGDSLVPMPVATPPVSVTTIPR